MTTNEIIAMIWSIGGMVATILSFQCKEKKRFLIFQIIGNLFYLISYVFAGGGIAVCLNVIFVIRNVYYILMINSEKSTKAINIVLCIACVVAYVLYVAFAEISIERKLVNVLPMIGAIFGTVATYFNRLNTIRLWKYGDSLSWLVFNVYIGFGALGGIIGEVLNLISLTVGIIRGRGKNKVE